MPLHDLICVSCGARQERYLPLDSSPNPKCEDVKCGGETERAISRFGVIWTGDLSKYTDRSLEVQGRDHREPGHWATAIRTQDGKPRQVYIDSIQSQRAFAKAEGCVPPDQLGTNMEATSDKTLRERGLPGQWV